MNGFPPEGRFFPTPENQAFLSSPEGLQKAMTEERIIEGLVKRCDTGHNLHIACGDFTGFMPRNEAAMGIQEGTTREIAILSRVGKPVSFLVEGLEGSGGRLVPILSRRRAQEKALAALMTCRPGDILPATVTHLEPFGAFVDLGCGVPSMIGIDRISVSRIPHPDRRFRVGQEIYVVVTGLEPERNRLLISHRELLGTWAENAARFSVGETVAGRVRGLKEYGAFIELTPNLSGLAELCPGLQEEEPVSVYIKSILPDRMKIKLQIIDRLFIPPEEEPLHYFHTQGQLGPWHYAPAEHTSL